MWIISNKERINVQVTKFADHFCINFRDLYRRIKNQRNNNDKKSTWHEKFIPNLNSFIPFQNSSSKSNSSQESDMPYADAMDSRDIFTLVNNL